MPNRSPARWGVAALLLLLTGGLMFLLGLRMSSGEDYPFHSSLRADGNGTKLFFDSLAGTGRVAVSRKFQSLDQEPEANATIFLIGVRASSVDTWEKAARAGNRIVIAIDENTFLASDDSAKRWGLGVKVKKNGEQNDVYLDAGTNWAVIAERQNRPLAVQRVFGPGLVIVIAGSTAFDNQSIADGDGPQWLAFLASGRPRVIFDEAHLGLQEQGSITGLLRRYRLGGALIGLLILAVVFIWSNSGGFPPPDERPLRSVTGQDAHSGFVRLLENQIPREQLLALCVTEWARSHPQRTLSLPATKDILSGYRELQEQIKSK